MEHEPLPEPPPFPDEGRRRSLRQGSQDRESGVLDAVIDNLPVALFAKDASDDFRFIIWNKKQEQITTIPREKALGNTDAEIFSPESAEYFREVDEAVFQKGRLLEIPEEIIDTEKGGEIYLRTIKVPIKREGRALLVGISEDITERVRHREQLERLNQNLSAKNEELERTQLQLIQAEKLESIGRLAAGVAHEVKNPLALLVMGVEYLSEGVDPDDPNLPVILAEMREAIERADRIVRGLVDFSSDREISRELTDPVELCRHVLLLMRHEITKASVKVEEYFEKSPAWIRVDRNKFEQVLINVMINAIHAMADNAGPRELTITVRSDSLDEVARNEGARTARHFRSGDRVVIIEVKDNGSGIRKEDIGKVFDPFFTTKATGKGTGLGLSVVRKIVELHQGVITLRNRLLERGAVMQITLPAVPPPPSETGS